MENIYIKKIEKVNIKLEEIKISKDISRLPELKDLLLEFSECFYGHNPDKRMTIGNNILKSFFIEKINIIMKNNLYNEEDYNFYTQPTMLVNTIYSNKEAIEKLINNNPIKDILNTQNVAQLIFSALQSKNTKLMDYIIEHSKLGPVVINQIKDSILKSTGDKMII